MRLYHGSTTAISHPDISFSRSNLDFGKGFYATSLKAQAERWAKRKAVLDGGSPIVNIYDMADHSSLRILKFSKTDAAWVEFVCDCRRGGTQYQAYDLIIGSVADDKVYEAVNMYFKGFWDIDTTLEALRFYDNNDQYCFVSQDAIDSALKYVDSYEVAK